ncbi:hypothetical protein KJ764_04355 [Patescibacteria group bacterium]|nr:hypothetical protein [Patescibacteria group bacterium]
MKKTLIKLVVISFGLIHVAFLVLFTALAIPYELPASNNLYLELTNNTSEELSIIAISSEDYEYQLFVSQRNPIGLATFSLLAPSEKKTILYEWTNIENLYFLAKSKDDLYFSNNVIIDESDLIEELESSISFNALWGAIIQYATLLIWFLLAYISISKLAKKQPKIKTLNYIQFIIIGLSGIYLLAHLIIFYWISNWG